MEYVDAHIHLSDPEYEAQVHGVLEDARRADIVALVSNSMNLQTSLRSIELTEEYPGFVFAALGIHPWNVKKLSQNELEQTVDLISSHCQHRGVVAVGEIGLDYKYVKRGKEELVNTQYEVFCKMLQLSEKLSLPAIIHSRGTTVEIIDMLPSYNVKRVLLHWFSNPIELLPRIVEQGYFISEGPATLFSDNIKEIVRRIPLANLLTETDGPVRFFKQPFDGKRASPVHVPLVVEAVAKIRGQERVEVAEQIHENFVGFFGTE